MRPSIMSEGDTTSAPASAWDTACLQRYSTVSSFITTPSSRTIPSWPSQLYGSRATSVYTCAWVHQTCSENTTGELWNRPAGQMNLPAAGHAEVPGKQAVLRFLAVTAHLEVWECILQQADSALRQPVLVKGLLCAGGLEVLRGLRVGGARHAEMRGGEPIGHIAWRPLSTPAHTPWER